MAIYDVNGNNLSAMSRIAQLSDYGDLSTPNGFAAAFDAAVSDPDIVGVDIPFGQYSLASSLIMRSNFRVNGNGATITMSGTSDTFRFVDVHDCLVENININMAQTKNTSNGTALYMLDVSHITCRNMRIYNIGVRACLAYVRDQTSAGVLDYLTFDNLIMEGIGEENTNLWEWPCGIIAVNARHSTMRNCVVSGMSRFTLEFKNFSSDCSMIDNTIVGGYSGLCLGGDRPADDTILANRITFMGNRVTECKYPLYFGRAYDLNIVGNVVYGDSMWIEKCQKCLISDNIIVGSDTSNYALVDIRYGSYIIFQNNRYEKNSNVNLYNIVDSADTTISGYYNGKYFSETNPSSGTPTVS